MALFRLRPLRSDPANNFARWSRATWKQCQVVLTDTKQTNSLKDFVRLFDSISEDACLVLDSANCIANVHEDKETRQVAARTFLGLYEHVQVLNLDHEAYARLKSLYQQTPRESMNDELDRVARKMIREFEWEGACFEDVQRKTKINSIQNDIRELEAQAADQEWDMNSNRPPMAIDNKNYPNDHRTFFHLASLGDSAAKTAYVQHYRSDPILERLASTRDKLRRKRHDLARLLGFDSFSHFQLNKNMAEKPQVANEFLLQLVAQLEPLIRKTIPTGMSYYQVPLLAPQSPIFKQQQYNKVNEWLTLGRCLRGLRKVAKRVFNIDIAETTLSDATWCSDRTGCLEWIVMNPDGSTRGVLFLDLFEREGKSSSPALYQIRTRRHGKASDDNESVALLSCSFRHGMNSSIGHLGFRTLMHEFGHALQAIMSETEYQHLGGTRCEMDFSETPSLLLERMAWHPSVLQLLNEDGTMTEDYLKSIEQFRTSGFSAFELYEQAILGVYDLRLFGAEDQAKSDNEVYWDVHKRLSCVRLPDHPNEIRSEVFFNHALGRYAGNFYTYSWSSAIATQIWSKLFEGNPLDRDAGKVFKREVLEAGGSREPFQAMKSMLGSAGSVVDPSTLVRDVERHIK